MGIESDLKEALDQNGEISADINAGKDGDNYSVKLEFSGVKTKNACLALTALCRALINFIGDNTGAEIEEIKPN